MQKVQKLVSQLRIDVAAAGEKTVTVLTRSGECAREMGGAQALNCKSGKDRTSMLITHEAAEVILSSDGKYRLLCMC